MRLGVDFGGTKIEAALLDSKGALLARQRAPNPGSYAAALDAVADLTSAVEAVAGVRASTAGCAVPGSISPVTGRMRNANAVWLNGTSLLEDLRAALQRPVRLANDANCFALSEAVDGAGATGRVVFGAILGTGCGGGVVVDGELLTGANSIAGEWGHTPLPWARADEVAPQDWCGRGGCLEQWISGSGFRRWAGMSAEEADAAARAGNAEAIASIDLLGDRIARGLAVVIDILDPDVIVLGGGLSNIDALYAIIHGKLPSYVFSDVVTTRVVKNSHGDSSGVRGAAWLFSAEEAA